MLERPFDPETRIVSRQAAPPVLERGCDICVVGSGASGASAAIEAARAGRSVIVVDGLPTLGGQAVNSIIGMFCGLFTPGPNGRQLTHGVADEIIHDLKATGDLELVGGRGDVERHVQRGGDSARWVEKKAIALKAGVTPLTGAIIRAVNMYGRRVSSLDIATRFGDVRVTADAFIDASGDAAYRREAGLDCHMHQERPGLSVRRCWSSRTSDDSKAPPRAEMANASGTRAGLRPAKRRRDGFAATYPGRNAAMVNITHIETPLVVTSAPRSSRSRARRRPTTPWPSSRVSIRKPSRAPRCAPTARPVCARPALLDSGDHHPDGGRGQEPDGNSRPRLCRCSWPLERRTSKGRLCVGRCSPRTCVTLCAAGLADRGGRGQPMRRGPLHRRGFHGSVERCG